MLFKINKIIILLNSSVLRGAYKKSGYKTGFVGKCHVIDHDLLKGNERKVKESWQRNDLQVYGKSANPRKTEVNNKMGHNHRIWSEKIKNYGFDFADAVYAANLRELFNDSLNCHNVEWKNKAVLDFIDEFYKEPFFLYYCETVPHDPAP
ncbi:hypothetical protein HX109_13010 [Galbibacter sp. BG1]|uniref:hypothetical protein n=1 Tax=Galbibacter sp. BG1 TaxID=1170699 RepID=UPI0015C000F6|nr:hypothetical protein [Galbibacter sp. BG1]QLE02430.1 hypothetical protein HX109_13010 [Galbibacter sp. BG1]